MRKFLSLFAVLALFCLTALSQAKNVTGRVTDQLGQPVPFATVKIKGGKQGIPADAEGNFTIKAKPGDVLVISGAGFGQKEVKVDGSTVTVQINRKEGTLTEVIVTGALGINKQAKELGYSTARVQGKDIVVAKPISVANGLTGKVSGLQINTVNNGLFAPTRITLRGNRSLTGNNQPLIVVDGAIYYNDINTINTEDILDLNVLKGASASAVYGSDASNGVIIINTKHGARGARPVISVSSTVQLETVAYLPSFQTQFGSSGGEYYVYDENDLSTYVPYENQQYGPKFNGAIVPYGRKLADGTLHTIPYSAVKNQKKDFFDKGVTTQNNFSYSSGDDNSKFFVSAQDIQSKNIMPGDKGRRDAFRVAGAKTYGIFSADYSLSYTYKYQDVTNTGAVYQNVLNSPGEIPLSTLKDWKNNPLATTDGYYNDYFYNPYWTIGNIRNKTTENNLSGNVHLQLKPAKWLTLSYRLAVNNLTGKYEYQQGEADYSDWSANNDTVFFANKDASAFVPITSWGTKWINGNNSYKQPAYNTSSYSNFLITSDFVASFSHNLTKDITLNLNLGTTYIDNQINSLSVNANNIFFPVYNVNSQTGIPSLGQSYYEARKLGYFGDGQIGYKSFFYVHGSYRTDIDSRLSKSNRFIPYYDIDASIVVSDLIPGMKDSKGLDYLKINGAHSVTGNASPLSAGSAYIGYGAYKTTPTLYSAGGFPFNGLGGYLLNGLIPNPNIKPEQVTENELGIEFGFMQDRITLHADVFDQKLRDGIVYATLPLSTGSTTALLNAANTHNQGIEVDLKAGLVKTRDFSWNVSANYTYNKIRVQSINGGQTSLQIGGANGNAYAVVGQSYPVIETHDWVRDATNGKVIVDQVTGLPSEDPNVTVLGQATPAHILGLTTSLTWKNFTFNATADYRGGYKIFNSIGEYMAFTGSSSYTTQTGRQRFVFPNSEYSTDGGKTYIANTKVTTDDANYNLFPGIFSNTGSPYVMSAAAWKLREIAISYNIPRSILSRTKVLQGATFTISGRNLLMFRPKTNIWTDPEFSEDTSNAVGRTSTSEAPPSRIFSATLALTF